MPKKATAKRTKPTPRRVFTDAQKQRVLIAADKTSVKAAAKRYKVGENLIYRWKRAANGDGERAPTVAASPRAKAPTKRRKRVKVRNTKVSRLESENTSLRNIVIDQLLVIKELQRRV